MTLLTCSIPPDSFGHCDSIVLYSLDATKYDSPDKNYAAGPVTGLCLSGFPAPGALRAPSIGSFLTKSGFWSTRHGMTASEQ